MPTATPCSSRNRWCTVVTVLVASMSTMRSRWASITPNVRLRALASTSSGNQPRTSSAHSARPSVGPPGASPASVALATYLRTVLGSMPRLDATTDFGRPACQCCRTSTTSITSNCLLAKWTSLLGEQGVYRCKEPGGWIPRPDGGPGNNGGGEVGNYVGVKPLQLGNYFGADTTSC